MKLYFDTSALVKFFHNELATKEVTKMINSNRNVIYISELAKLEFYSALYRRFRNNEIDFEKLNNAIKAFDIQTTDFFVEPVGNMTVIEAENLLKKYGHNYGLRTLDALHLSTFKLISEDNWFFVTSDIVLYNVVKKMNFNVINPLNM